MNKKYFIFTDLDLTIYPECKIMPREIIDYFNKLVDLGNMVVLCTGRPLTGSKYIYDLFSNKLILACDNGTRILKPYDNSFKKINSSININSLHSLIQRIKDGIYMMLTIGEKDIYGYNLDKAPFWMFHKLEDSKLFDDINFTANIKEDITLLNLYIYPEYIDYFNSIISDYPELKVFNWGIERDGVYCLEIYSNSGDKSFAVKELKKLYPEYISFAFGDQLNDIPMLKEADFGVAISNARQEVKDIADYITEYDCDNLGVIRFLEKVIK